MSHFTKLLSSLRPSDRMILTQISIDKPNKLIYEVTDYIHQWALGDWKDDTNIIKLANYIKSLPSWVANACKIRAITLLSHENEDEHYYSTINLWIDELNK